MNSTEFFEHVSTDFPTVYLDDHLWVNVHDGVATKLGVLSALLFEHLKGSRAIVVVHSPLGIGVELPLDEVCTFVAPHVLTAEIHIADLDMQSFVAILDNGVAAGWRRGERP